MDKQSTSSGITPAQPSLTASFDTFFPFHRLGLTKNPFGTLTHEEWVAVTLPPPALVSVIQSGFRHLQVIGERGHGKSTALLWLCDYLTNHGKQTAYERLPKWHFNYHTDISALDVFALDEAQRLFILNQQRLFHQAQGKTLIIGTHISWQRAFRLHRWDVTTIHIADHITRDFVQQLLHKRLTVLATEQGAQLYFDDSAVNYLWERWGNQLRGMEWFLYHCLQTQRETGAITAHHLEQASINYTTPAGLY